jgi:endonuclease-3
MTRRPKPDLLDGLPPAPASRRRRAAALFRRLARAYPDARCELNFKTPFQLLAATILSAQCTDKNVNRVTPGLFAAWPDAASLARARPSQVAAKIRSLGLYRMKARSLVGMARALMQHHGGQVPRTRSELTALPGVGRKTANVVLSNAFGLPGLAVDTHVLRVGKRLGLLTAADAVKAELELCAQLPPDQWGMASHRLIWHGRRICTAREPRCGGCVVSGLCPSAGRSGRSAS